MTMTDQPPRLDTPAQRAAAERLAARRPESPPAQPPPPAGHDTAPPSRLQIDRLVGRVGLPVHPPPRELASQVRGFLRLLESDGLRALTAAEHFAARGWPTGTLGDGGSRGNAELTSVESAVIGRTPKAEDPHRSTEIPPGPFDNADLKLAQLLRMLWQTTTSLQRHMVDLLAHAEDLDAIPVGRGECACCGKFCDPAKDSNDRLRSNLCNACRMALTRAQREAGEQLTGVNRVDWAHTRRHQLFEGREGECDLCKRPWTADAVAS